MTNEELYYHSAVAQASEQDIRRKHFDTMAVGILAFAATLVGVTSLSVSHWNMWSPFFFGLTMLAFVSAAWCSIWAVRLRSWKKQPKLEDLSNHIESGEYSNHDMTFWTAIQLSNAVQENEEPLDIKARWLQAAYFFLFVQGVFTGGLFATVGLATSS